MEATATLCDYPIGEPHPVGDAPVKVWAHGYGMSLYCGYILLCQECAREGREDNWLPEYCESPNFASHIHPDFA